MTLGKTIQARRLGYSGSERQVNAELLTFQVLNRIEVLQCSDQPEGRREARSLCLKPLGHKSPKSQRVPQAR